MPTMAELLTDEQARRLNEIQFPATPLAQPGSKPTTSKAAKAAPKYDRQCACPRRHDGFSRDGDLLVHKACGRPLPTASVLRGASAVPVVVPCAGGCGSNVTIATRKDVTDEPRVATCVDCARAIAQGSSVTIRKTKPAAPIGVTTKEPHVPINIDDIPSAKLGETIKEAERARLAAEMPAKVEEAKKKRAKAEKAERKAARAERVSLTEQGVLPEFSLLGVEVPALDVAGLASLAEIPNGKARSPYNKVRYREGLPLLSHMEEPGVGETCTWGTLVAEHRRMLAVAQEQPTEPTKKGKAKAQISAPVDLSERTKVEAIMQAVGCSEKKARKILASV